MDAKELARFNSWAPGEPVECSQGFVPYNKAHLDAKDARIEQLRAWADDEQRGRHKAEEDRTELRAENERLRAALEPFQRNVDALSLSAALGHIDREALWNARHAYEQPVMQAAREAAERVDGWSDAKKDAARRIIDEQPSGETDK